MDGNASISSTNRRCSARKAACRAGALRSVSASPQKRQNSTAVHPGGTASRVVSASTGGRSTLQTEHAFAVPLFSNKHLAHFQSLASWHFAVLTTSAHVISHQRRRASMEPPPFNRRADSECCCATRSRANACGARSSFLRAARRVGESGLPLCSWLQQRLSCASAAAPHNARISMTISSGSCRSRHASRAAPGAAWAFAIATRIPSEARRVRPTGTRRAYGLKKTCTLRVLTSRIRFTARTVPAFFVANLWLSGHV